MKSQIHHMKNRRRLLGSACAGVVAALAASSAYAVPELILDLRVAGGGKTVSISSSSPTANLELFALVLDPDVTASNTGFNATQGIWTSSNGGLQGNLSASLISPFNSGAGSQNPTPADRDGDGDLDVGPSSQSASSGFFISSSGTTGVFTPDGTETIGSDTYRRFKIGTGTFTGSNFSTINSTQLSFLPRIGDAVTRPHKYLKDSTSTLTSIKGDDVRLSLGSNVTVNVTGTNYTWTRGAATSNWADAGNWNNAPHPDSPLDTATFTNTGVGAVNIAGTKVVGSISFTNSTGNYNITGAGSTLVLDNGSGVGTISDTGTGTVQFATSLVLAAGTLNVTSAAGGGPLTINGIVNANVLNKNGSGNLTLAGSVPSNISQVNVNQGTLRVQTTAALGGANLTLNNSGFLQLFGNSPINVAGSVIAAGNGTINVDRASTGTNLTHVIGGSLVMTGPTRTLTVGGANGYDLSVTGSTDLQAASTFAVTTSGSDLTLLGPVFGTGSLTKTGAGQMVLGGSASNNFQGGTTVNGGSLVLSKPQGVNAVGGNVTVNSTGTLLWQNHEQIPNTATLTLNSGGTLNLNGYTETVESFVDNGGTTIFGGGSLVTGDLVLTNGTTIATQTSLGGHLVYTGTTTAATISGNLAVVSNLVNHNFTIANGTADPDVNITGSISGASNVTKLGDGALTYGGSSANTLSGLTTVSAGLLNLNKPAGTDAIAGPLEILGGTVKLLANNQINNASTVNVGPSGTLDLTSRQETIASLIGSGTILGSGGQLTVNTNNISTTFSGNITGGLALSNGGIAEIRLTGINTLSNLSTGAGTVTVASAANIGGASVTLQPGGKFRADGTFSSSGAFADSAPGSTGIEVTSGNTLTLTGNLTNNASGVSFSKTGSGTLVLSGNVPAYQGNISVDAGTLALTSGRPLSAGSDLAIAEGATVNLSGTLQTQFVRGLAGAGHVVIGSGLSVVGDSDSLFSGQITGTGTIDKQGDSTLTLTGLSNFGGSLFVQEGTLAVSGAGKMTSLGSLQVVGEGAFPSLEIVDGGTASAASGYIAGTSGASSVSLSGEGSRLAISGNLSVGAFPSSLAGTGTIDIDEGATLDVGGTITLHNNGSSAIDLGGGTLRAASLVASNSSRFDWTSGSLELGTLSIGASSPVGQSPFIEPGQSLVVGTLNVGSNAGNILTVRDGGTMLSTAAGGAVVNIGATGAGGVVDITGAESSWTLTNLTQLTIGQGGAGTVTVQQGASVVADGNIHIGADALYEGTLVVTDADSRLETSGAIDVGTVGAATLAATVGGSISTSSSLTIRGDNGGTMNVEDGRVSANSLHLIGGTSTVNSGGLVGVGGSGMTMDRGELSLTADAASPGTLSLDGTFTSIAAATSATISSTTPGASELPGAIDLLGGDRIFSIANGAAANDVTISARIANGGLIKQGAGTLVLSGDNSYSGITSIVSGAVVLGRNDAIPAASAVTLSGTALLNLNNFSTVVGSLDGTSASSSVELGSGVLTAGGDNSSTQFAGLIGGTTGGIVKQGTGMWTISGDLNFAGSVAQSIGVTVADGTLRLTGANASLSAPIFVRSTGASMGTLATATNNLGSGSLTLDSGRLLVEGSFARSNNMTLAVGGGTIAVNSGFALTMNGALAGQGGLIKTGGGGLDLFSASSYVGGTSIRDGNVIARVAGAIPANTNIDIQSNLQLNTNGSLELRASQTAASISGTGSITFLNSSVFTVGAGGATTEFEGPISGAGGIVKQGSGTLTLSGALGISGGVAVTGGKVILAGTGAFGGAVSASNGGVISAGSDSNLGAAGNDITLDGGTFQATAGFDMNRAINIGAGGGTIDVVQGTLNHHGSTTSSNQLLKTGGGSLALDNPSTFSGPIKVNGGAVILNDDSTLISVASIAVNTGGKFTLNNGTSNQLDRIRNEAPITLAGGELHVVGHAGISSETLGELTLAPGASTIRLEEGASGTTQVTFGSLATPIAGATVDFAIFAAGSTNKLLFTAAPPPMEGWATVNGSDFATYTANGVEAMANYTAAFGPGNNVKLNATPAPPVTATDAATLNLESATTVDVQMNGQTLTLSKGGLIKSGSGSASISGGSLTSGNGQLAVTTSGAQPLTLTASLTGSMDLLKSGGGTLVLDSANTFSGTTYLNAGTLAISTDANLGASSNDVHFNGGTLNVADDVIFSASRMLHAGSGGGEINIPLDVTASLPNANQLSGSGSLTKSGQGTLQIGGSNTYSGYLTVARGTLQLDHTSALGTGSSRGVIVMDQGSNLRLRSDASPATFGYDVVVSDVNNYSSNVATINTAKLTPSGTPGVFELGSLTIGNATLRYEGTEGTLAFTGVTTLTGAATIETVRDMTLAGRITGPGSLEKSGNASLTLGSGPSDTAANTYTDDTIISGGNLILNKAAGTIAIRGDIVMNGGTLSLNQPQQIADTSKVGIGAAATFDVAESDSVSDLDIAGQAKIRDGANFSSDTTKVKDGGKIEVGEEANTTPSSFTTRTAILEGSPLPGPVLGLKGTGSSNLTSGVSAMTANARQTIVVTEGLTFSGVASENSSIKLVEDSVDPGELQLSADVLNSSTSGTAQILSVLPTSGGSNLKKGTVALQGLRSFTTTNTISDLLVTAQVTNLPTDTGTINGGIKKLGPGKLILTASNTYSLGTTIQQGTLEARGGTLGTGTITIGGAGLELTRLHLRNNAASVTYGNDLTVVGDSTIDIDRVDGGTTAGVMKLGRLNLKNRLNVSGANGRSLEFASASSLTGPAFIQNSVPVSINAGISGPHSLTKDAGGGTLTFGGSSPNDYTGPTNVNLGTLELNKPAGTTAIPGALNVIGGGVVKWMASDQVSDASALSITAVGLEDSKFDLNGKSDVVASLAMTAGTVTTSGGVLKLTGNLTSFAASKSAKIMGQLSLDTTRTFTVEDSPSIDDELIVEADISGKGGIIKAGDGGLVLSGNNSFTGGVSISAGTVKTLGSSSLSGAVNLAVTTGTYDLPGGLTTAANAVITKSGAGAMVVRGAQSHGAGARLQLDGGSIALNTDAGSANSRTLTIAASAGSLTLGSTQHVASFSTSGTAIATLTSGGNKVIVTDSISATGSAKLDLKDGALIVRNGVVGGWDGSRYSGIAGMVDSGRNLGAWDGFGIVTTQSNAIYPKMRTTLATMKASEVQGATSEFRGETVTSGDVIVAYTWGGDANLNGMIDADDFFRIDTHVDQSGSVFGFSNGDFNYDGLINGDDYFVLDSNFNAQGSPTAAVMALSQPEVKQMLQATGGELSTGVTAVPEPSTLGLIALAAPALLKRRRRSQ